MRSPSIVACLLATCLAATSTLAAEDPIKLVAFQYPPLVYTEQGEIKGAATALVKAVFAQLDVAVEIQTLPWARALQYMQHGQADAVFTIFKNPERELFLRYPDEVLIEQEIRLYVRADHPIRFDGELQQLAPYRIGLTQAVSYGQRFDQASQQLLQHITYVNDEETKFLLLDKGRVDVVVSSSGLAEFYLKRLQLEGRIQPLEIVLERVPSYLAFARASPHQDLAPRFAAALRQLKTAGRYQQIVAPSQPTTPESDRPTGENQP